MLVGFRSIPEKSVSWGQNAIDIKLSWWGCEQRKGMYWGWGGQNSVYYRTIIIKRPVLKQIQLFDMNLTIK
jgi:hypothetical protein